MFSLLDSRFLFFIPSIFPIDWFSLLYHSLPPSFLPSWLFIDTILTPSIMLCLIPFHLPYNFTIPDRLFYTLHSHPVWRGAGPSSILLCNLFLSRSCSDHNPSRSSIPFPCLFFPSIYTMLSSSFSPCAIRCYLTDFLYYTIRCFSLLSLLFLL